LGRFLDEPAAPRRGRFLDESPSLVDVLPGARAAKIVADKYEGLKSGFADRVSKLAPDNISVPAPRLGLHTALLPNVMPLRPVKMPARQAIKEGAEAAFDMASGEVAGPAVRTTGAVIKGVSKIPSWIGGRAINFRIKPSNYQFSYGRNPGQAVAEEIGPKLTMGQLERAVGKRSAELGSDVQSRLDKEGYIDVSDAFENYLQRIGKLNRSKRANKGIVGDLKDQLTDFAETGMSEMGLRMGGNRAYIPANKALEFKRFVADQGSFKSLDPATRSVAKAVNKFHADTNKGIRKFDPIAGQKSHRQSELIAAEGAIKARKNTEQRFWPIALQEAALLGGAGAGGFLGAGPEGAMAIYAALKAARSTPGATTLASAMGRTGKGMRLAGEAMQSFPDVSPRKALLRILSNSGKSLTART